MEQAVCATLITMGYCEGELKYSKLKIMPKGAEKLRFTRIVSDEFVIKYRSLFPPGKRSTHDEVMDKFAILFSESDYTEEIILDATTMYLESVNDLRFCEKAGNFISKRENGTVRKTLLEYIELLGASIDSESNYKGDKLI